MEIVASSIPHWVIMLAAVVVLTYLPQIATCLPGLLF
jgi:hypothetical protein